MVQVEAKQCDRCGAHWLPDDRVDSVARLIAYADTNMRLGQVIDTSEYRNTVLDLCHLCTSELEFWWNRGRWASEMAVAVP